MAAVSVFSPQMLNDLSLLRTTFFTGKKEIQEILQIPTKDLVKPERPHYFNLLQLTGVFVTIPVKVVYYIFLKTLAFLSSCLLLRSCSNHLHLRASYTTANISYAWTYLLYGNRLITPTMNQPQLEISDIYNQNAIKRDKIENPRIREKLNAHFKELNFNSIGDGLCHGGVNWFIFLFLKSLKTPFQGRVDTIWQYASAIGRQFENGQPRQAALLQATFGLEQDLLGLSKEFFELTNLDSEEILKTLKNLPAQQIASIKISRHEVAYMKFNNEELIWDPICGLIVIEKPEDLLEFLRYYYNNKDPITFVYYSDTPFNRIKHWLRDKVPFMN